LDNAYFYLYEDDTMIYCAGSLLADALANVQDVFDIIQIQLSQLMLILNVDKKLR